MLSPCLPPDLHINVTSKSHTSALPVNATANGHTERSRQGKRCIKSGALLSGYAYVFGPELFQATSLTHVTG